MTVELDRAYTSERNREAAIAASMAAGIWNSGVWLDDPDAWLENIAPVVRGGQAEQVALLDGYMSAKTEWATGNRRQIGLDADRYTVEALRRKSFAEVYGRPLGAAGYALKERFGFGRAMAMGRDRLVKTLRTDMQLSQVHAARDWMSTEPRIVGYRRQIGSANPCGLCVGAATQRYRTGNLAPIHEHCVSGDTLVAAKSVRQFTRRWYDGEVIILTTAGGNQLTVTPNHPVLTTKGWVAAGLLNEGDDVIRRGDGHRPVGSVPHEHEVPSPVENRFRAASMLSLIQMPFSAEDFHGDRGNSEVDVVPADGALRHRVESRVGQPSEHGAFTVGPENGVVLSGLCRRHERLLSLGRTAHSIMGGSSESSAFLGGHGSHAQTLRFAHGSGVDSRVAEDAIDRGAGYAEALGERIHRFAGQVTVDDSTGVDRGSARFPGASRFDSPFAEMPEDGAWGTDPDSGRRLLRSLAREVEVDRLVDCRRVESHDWVYNLRTDDGWYDANGIITHNCHCTVIPMFGQQDPGRVIESDVWEMTRSRAEGGLDARDLSRFNISAEDLPSRMQAVRDPELGLRLVDADWTAAARLSTN